MENICVGNVGVGVGACNSYSSEDKNNTIIGLSDLKGSNNVIIGAENYAEGNYNVISGSNVKIYGNNNTVIGNNVEIRGDNQTVIGNIQNYPNNNPRQYTIEILVEELRKLF